MKKFLPLLNRPARNGPFLPKFWTALATVIVGIFFRKKFWWGFRPISVAYQKEFWISWKKRRFQIFQKPSSPGFQSFLDYEINQHGDIFDFVVYFIKKFSHPYTYSRPYYYCFSLVVPPVLLFQAVRLFQTLEYKDFTVLLYCFAVHSISVLF